MIKDKDILTEKYKLIRENEEPNTFGMDTVTKAIESNNFKGIKVVTRSGDIELPINEIWNQDGILMIAVNMPANIGEDSVTRQNVGYTLAPDNEL